MNKKIFYLIAGFAIALLDACREQEMEVYNQPFDRIGFHFDRTLHYADSTTHYTFVYEPERTRDTVWVEMATIGFVADYDRPVTLQQIGKVIDTTHYKAVADMHYVALTNPDVAKYYVVKAGQTRANFPIIVLRHASLDTSAVELLLEVAANEHFQPGFPSTLEKRITITNQLVRPASWNFQVEWYFTGPYGIEKHRFMIQAAAPLGVTINDEFFSTMLSKDDIGLTEYWFGFFSSKLAEENAARVARGEDVLREAPLPGESIGAPVIFTQYQ